MGSCPCAPQPLPVQILVVEDQIKALPVRTGGDGATCIPPSVTANISHPHYPIFLYPSPNRRVRRSRASSARPRKLIIGTQTPQPRASSRLSPAHLRVI